MAIFILKEMDVSFSGRLLSKCLTGSDLSFVTIVLRTILDWFEVSFIAFGQNKEKLIAVIWALEVDTLSGQWNPSFFRVRTSELGGPLHKLIQFSLMDQVTDTPEVSQLARGHSAGRWQTPDWHPWPWYTVLLVCLEEKRIALVSASFISKWQFPGIGHKTWRALFWWHYFLHFTGVGF